MTERYALYLAPPPDSELYRFGARVIGRDARDGIETTDFAPEGWSVADWRAASAEPRRYGFHATLKAPFRLAEGATAAELCAAIEGFAAEVEPFPLGDLETTSLAGAGGAGFVALTPVAAAPGAARLADLERSVVLAFDAFRAPLSEAERARRKPERLTPRQRAYLERFGYPYVLEEFRLHFTLSGPVENPAPLTAALAKAFRREVASPGLRIDALALFHQAGPEAPFRSFRRFALSGAGPG